MSDATTAETAPDVEHDDGSHPTPRLYIEIAVVLSILTAMEFSTYFIDFGPLTTPLLIVLMVIKFALIVGFFMHLRWDTRLFTRFMMTGLVGAMVLYGIVFAAIGEIPNGIG